MCPRLAYSLIPTLTGTRHPRTASSSTSESSSYINTGAQTIHVLDALVLALYRPGNDSDPFLTTRNDSDPFLQATAHLPG